MAFTGFRAPALPLPPNDYNRQQFDELFRALRIYFNLIDSLTPQQAQSYRADSFFGGNFTGDSVSATSVSGGAINGGVISGFNRGIEAPYAMLMSDEDQSSAGITSENLISYNTPIFQYGIRVENNTRIKFDYAGQYLVVVNCQFTNRSNTAAEFELWAKDQGVNYPLSNTRFDIPARKSVSVWSHVVAVINGIFTVHDPETEYLEIAWWSDNADVYLEHYAAGTSPTRPEIPSVILTANFVSAVPSVFPIPQGDNLVLAGAAPSLLQGVVAIPPAGALTIAGSAPTVT
jgi:hypothetical protein